ncbi:hypothetical protein [Arthrobacter sp. H5]|uniref:hypothetical protein n=1 Tax=Arthrobacter sp. H5 TaxID=1267973 RepID=UPI000485BEA0|nr:hypothetical protein [Arthrobacter sp. H5]
MDNTTLEIVIGIAVPAAAIIISTWVAVGLAKSERVAAAAARAEERSDGAFVRALTALATLNTINLRAESVAEPLRELRVGLTLLEAASPRSDGDLLSEWFEVERVAGLAQSRESMRKLALAPKIPSSEADVDTIVAAGAPLNTWARDFANNLRLWRRKGATDAQLAELIANAKSLH